MKTKHLLFVVLLSFCFASTSNAQLDPGTPAPDWTATDIDGNVWDMSDMLASGKHVVLEFSATWCGPCWNFHQTGTLETLHDMFGPDGTDQIRVFYIEADQSTNTACLYGPAGCNSSTQGNWVAGHDFPFIDVGPGNAPGMPNNYAIGYYPTIYAVSANGENGVYEVGQETDISVWQSWFFESFEMSMTSVIVDAICPGEGSIQAIVQNGAGTITYQWSDGIGFTDYVDGLEAGSYTVTATDANGYPVVETFVVGGPTNGPVSVDLLASSDVNCYGQNSGALNVGGSGGNGGFSFLWNIGSSSTYIDGLSIGSYTVTVTDSQGCTEEETFFIDQPDFLTLTSLPEDASCGEEDGAVVAFASGGTSPFLYDFGDGFNSTGTFYNVAPGDYVMTVTDNNGCDQTSAFTIESTEGPTAEAAADGALDCSILEITVSGNGSSEGDNIDYEWNTLDGSIVEGNDQLDAVVNAAGTYTLIVTDNDSGCSETVSITVEANTEAPMVSIEEPEVLNCNVSATTLDASASSEGDDISFSWSTDDGNIVSGAAQNMAEIDAPGTYTFLITNAANGCTSEESVTVLLDDEAPLISVEDQVIDCSTTEVELCADIASGTIVTWTTPDGDVEATCITVNVAGTYTAEAKGENGCVATAESEVTLSADLPQVSIGQPEALTCISTTTVIEATLEGNAEDFDILWTSPTGEEINNIDLVIEVSEAGQYTLVVSNPITDCTTVTSVSVEEIIITPQSAFTYTLDDGTLILASESTGDPSTFDWSFGATDENTETIFEETGTYEICLTVVNDCGESTHCEDVYFVSQLKFETSTLDVLCAGESQGSISVVPSGGEPDYTISWAGPNGYTSSELEITNLVAGQYSMVLNDAYGYEKTESYTLSEPDLIIEFLVEITDETNSDGNGSISLEVHGGTGSLVYVWSNGATTSAIEGLAAGDYSVVVTDENGCSKEFGPYNVKSSIVGVEELTFVSEMNIYPVPTVNYLNVAIELNTVEATQLRVIDAYGKVISTKKYAQKDILFQLNVSDMPAGIYYIEFGNKDGRSLEKFVVIK